MENAYLYAISPVDGRYAAVTYPLTAYFSESSLIRYRLFVEIEYFISLCELPLPQLTGVAADELEKLRLTYQRFTAEDAMKVKEIEKTTNHDVKSVEYFLKNRLDESGLGKYREFVHFGLTSQDINNTVFPYSVKNCTLEIMLPAYRKIVSKLKTMAEEWKDIAMLGRTHGQPASPTRLGKEIFVFAERLENQLDMLNAVPYTGKFGGATGNFNAHYVSYPEIDWKSFADRFLKEKLGISRQVTTTQIEHYDYLAAYFNNIERINTILIDLCRDFWMYISMEYFKQQVKEGEVGSSTMPHKVNPIDFENAEGNLGLANAFLSHLSSKLPVSRLQRDLTDSTVIRNIGVPLAHTLISLNSITRGLNKLIVNKKKIDFDLGNNWAVVSEALQTILRREGYRDSYEELKKLTRGNEDITEETIKEFINQLDVNESVKDQMRSISPFNYTGI